MTKIKFINYKAYFSTIRNRWLFILCFIFLFTVSNNAISQSNQSDIRELFPLEGSRNIMGEDDFGIVNGRLTFRVNYQDLTTSSGLYAPPYAGSDFLMEIRFFGEKILTCQNYKWYPNEMDRQGEIHGVDIATSTVLTAGKRAGIIAINFENKMKIKKVVPGQFNIKGILDYIPEWSFDRPKTVTATKAVAGANTLIKQNDAGQIAIHTGKMMFINDAEVDKLLRGQYREPFVMPDKVSS